MQVVAGRLGGRSTRLLVAVLLRQRDSVGGYAALWPVLAGFTLEGLQSSVPAISMDCLRNF